MAFRRTTGGLRLAKPGYPFNVYGHDFSNQLDLAAVCRLAAEFFDRDDPRAIKTLRKRIGELKQRADEIAEIEWENEAEPLPFKIEELIAMTLMLTGPLRLDEIHDWIGQSFAYFCKMPRYKVYGERLDDWYASFQRVFRKYYTPINRVGDYRVVDVSKARIFYPRMFGIEAPKQPEDCLFFRMLPPELRNRIYEYVMALPPNGVEIYFDRSDFGQPRLRTLTRYYNDDHQLRAWYGVHRNHKLEIGSLAAVLGVTAVNRQMRHEAVSFFFSINTLVFGDLRTMCACLETMPDHHRNNISHISFIWHDRPFKIEGISRKIKPPNATDAQLAFGYLCAMPRLKKLEIYFEDILVTDNIPGNFYAKVDVDSVCFGPQMEEVVLHCEWEYDDGEYHYDREVMNRVNERLKWSKLAVGDKQGEEEQS